MPYASKPTTLKNVVGFDAYGKMSWATTIDGVAVDSSNPNVGWFVGYVEKGNNVYFFATNVEHPAPVPDTFIPGRRRITEKMLAELGVI